MATASRLIRAMLMAAPGKELICADFAGIEARVLVWLAGDEEGLELFRSGADIYLHMASAIYDRPITKADKKERQVGKTAILGLGYGMGAVKFRATCAQQAGVELSMKEARRVVKVYRRERSAVQELWRNNEAAAIAAVKTKERIEYGKVAYEIRGNFLTCELPSGRRLYYAEPKLSPVMLWVAPAEDDDGNQLQLSTAATNPTAALELRAKQEEVKITGPAKQIPREVLSYMGVVKNQWTRETTYAGKLTENIDQAVARDLLATALLRVEAAGYPVVLHVHDEIVSEVDKGFGSLEEFEGLMAELPYWAKGCPVSAEGWRGGRYRK